MMSKKSFAQCIFCTARRLFCVEGFSSSSLYYIGAFFALFVPRPLVYSAGQPFLFLYVFY